MEPVTIGRSDVKFMNESFTIVHLLRYDTNCVFIGQQVVYFLFLDVIGLKFRGFNVSRENHIFAWCETLLRNLVGTVLLTLNAVF